MDEVRIPQERITRRDIDSYKREILEQSVLVTPGDAAMILSCSTRKVLGLVQDGRISGYGKVRSNGLRILARDLREYVRSIKIKREEWNE